MLERIQTGQTVWLIMSRDEVRLFLAMDKTLDPALATRFRQSLQETGSDDQIKIYRLSSV